MTQLVQVKKSPLAEILVIFALTGFAVGQPLFDLFGKSPEFFIIRRTGATEIISFLLLVLFAIPMLFGFVAILLQKISVVASKGFFYLFNTLLSACIVLPVLVKWFGTHDKGGNVICIFAIIFGVLVSLLYARRNEYRKFCSYLAFAPPLFAIFFIYSLIQQGVFSVGTLGVGVVSEKTKPVPVFLVVFDEFPLVGLLNEKREINEARFPGFAELAGTSTWFRNGTSVSSWTERAVPIILSGQYPDEKKKQLPSLQYYPQNLFTLLSQTHAIHGYEQVTHLCPDSICEEASKRDSIKDRLRILLEDAGIVYLHYLLPEGKKKFLPNIMFQWGGFLENEPNQKPIKKNKKGLLNKGQWSDDVWLYSQFLDSIKGEVPRLVTEGKVPFYMIHITFPHVPYRCLPDGRKYFRALDSINDKGYKKLWADSDEWASIQADERFILQAGCADRMVADLLTTLRKVEIFDKSMVVVTADHGTSFRPGEYSRRVSDKNFMEVMPVPYFVKLPDQKLGNISDRNVETIDFVPTILEANGIEGAVPLSGNSVFDVTTPERSSKTFFPLEEKKPKIVFPSILSFEPALSRSINIFGSGGFDKRFFEIAPAKRELIGVNVSSLSGGGVEGVTPKIDDIKDHQEVDSRSGYLPAFITGELTKENVISLDLKGDATRLIAIAVDGKIGCITQSETVFNGIAQFSCLLPPYLLSEGKHSVEALVIK